MGYIEDVLFFGQKLTLVDIIGASLIIIGSLSIFIIKYYDTVWHSNDYFCIISDSKKNIS